MIDRAPLGPADGNRGRATRGCLWYLYRAMRRAVVCLLGLALVAACAQSRSRLGDFYWEEPEGGRELVEWVLEPPAFYARSSGFLGYAVTALSSLPGLMGRDPDGVDEDHLVEFTLPDGTIVGGHFFSLGGTARGPRPLLIASFGLLQDRWGGEANKFRKLYLDDPAQRLPAHVLILDHPTSGSFYARNGVLSIGSYDDGRMWIEVARIMHTRLPISSIHLLGVSMSGQTVVHALIEDQRRGLGLFASGLALSIAPDFRREPGSQLAGLPTPEGVANPWVDVLPDDVGEPSEDWLQRQAIELLIGQQFIPSYRRALGDDDDGFALAEGEIAPFLYQAMEERIGRLRGAPSWSPDMARDSLAAYVTTTRVAAVVDRARTPLVLLSSQDDPAVPSASFAEVAEAAGGNPWVIAYESPRGGHFGFDVAYGSDYVGDLIRVLLDAGTLASWTDGEGAGVRAGGTRSAAPGAVAAPFGGRDHATGGAPGG